MNAQHMLEHILVLVSVHMRENIPVYASPPIKTNAGICVNLHIRIKLIIFVMYVRADVRICLGLCGRTIQTTCQKIHHLIFQNDATF